MEEDSKYSEIIKSYSYEQLCYERAIVNKRKTDLYIQDKELDNEFKRRLEERRGNGGN